jgi:hypothetical protein
LLVASRYRSEAVDFDKLHELEDQDFEQQQVREQGK